MTKALLTIGILTHNDFDGTYFTMSSIRLHHSEVADRIRFVVIDNSPDGPQGKALYDLTKNMSDVDYHQVRGVSSSTFKNLSFELARTPYVLQMDCHVLLRPHALEKLIKFYEAFPDCHDLLQGPLYSDDNKLIATHMEPNWRGGNFGTWDIDKRGQDENGEMFEIPMHGMGLFACSRVGWPRFAPGMRAFGAEEGALHEKFRLLGRKVYCLPFLGWLHRFARPNGANYSHTHEDKIRNYLAAFHEAQLPTESIREHYKHRIMPHDHSANEKWVDDLMAFEKTLPDMGLRRKPGIQPFLGRPIKQLPDA